MPGPSCQFCQSVRVVLFGGIGAAGGAWLALRWGVDRDQLLMPATVGALIALAIAVLVSKKGR